MTQQQQTDGAAILYSPTDLVRDGIHLANAIAQGKADALTARETQASRSAELALTAFRAALTPEPAEIKEKVAATVGKGVWGKVKASWSEGQTVAAFLKAGNVLPYTGNGSGYIVGGMTVDTVTADHMEAIAEPMDDDASLLVLVKAIRARKKNLAERADAAASVEDARIAAYLRGPVGRIEHKGLTVDDIRPLRIEDPTRFGDIMVAGAALLAAEFEAAEAQRKADETANLVAGVCDMIETGAVSDEYMARLVAAVTARKAAVAAQTAESKAA